MNNRDTNSDGESSSRGSSVSFSTVEFHEHAMILGCSPSTSHGPPIEIGWESLSSMCFALDDYEDIRPPRRDKHSMAMPASLREAVLMENGYTLRQINDHLNLMKQERIAADRSILKKMPIQMLNRAKRSFFGSLPTR